MKILTLIAASAFAMTMSGLSVAAEDQAGGQQHQPSAAQQSGGGQTGQSNAQTGQSGQAGKSSQGSAEMQAAMKKCEQGPAADKMKCMDAAKKKHGQM